MARHTFTIRNVVATSTTTNGKAVAFSSHVSLPAKPGRGSPLVGLVIDTEHGPAEMLLGSLAEWDALIAAQVSARALYAEQTAEVNVRASAAPPETERVRA